MKNYEMHRVPASTPNLMLAITAEEPFGPTAFTKHVLIAFPNGRDQLNICIIISIYTQKFSTL